VSNNELFNYLRNNSSF